MPRIRQRSISLPITLASVAVALSIALLIGWTIAAVRRVRATDPIAPDFWLIVAGILSLVLIMSVLVAFSVFLVREILEGRRQTSFIDSVTHELKSPLASIKLCLETLERPELSPPQRETLRRMMLLDVERLSTFIDDVLEANRVAHGRRAHLMTEVSLADLVRQAAESVATRHNLPADRVQQDIPPDLRLTTDRTALETVLRNLLDNAVKYSTSGAVVRVRATPSQDGEVLVEVQDAGIGIDRRDLKRIFERFYRAPTEEVRARRGTGLGLFVVAALVRSLGGRVEARSEGLGHGTTIRVRLPTGPPGEAGEHAA